MLVQQFWRSLAPATARFLGSGAVSVWLFAHVDKFPWNGQIVSACIYGVCLILYVLVSLLTCSQPFEMDRLLHRGKYQVAGEQKLNIRAGFRLSKLAGVNENFTRGDRRIAYFTFWWGVTPNVLSLAVVVWNLGFQRWTWQMWWGWHYFWAVGIPIVGGVVTTIWFTWGVTKDMRQLFRSLLAEKVDITDNGQIRTPQPEPAALPATNNNVSA